jgi:hypothetical protein
MVSYSSAVDRSEVWRRIAEPGRGGAVYLVEIAVVERKKREKYMRSLVRLLVIAGLVAGLGCLAYAAEVQGILLDRECSPKIVQAKDQQAAQAHTRDCALMDACVKAGYGVFTADGKFVLLDQAGNAKALAALKASRKKDNIRVQVTGDQTGDTIKVTAIKIL